MSDPNSYSITIPELKDKAGNPAKARVVVNRGGQGYIEVEEIVYRGVRHTCVRMWCTTDPEPVPYTNPTTNTTSTVKWEDRTATDKDGRPLVIGEWRVPNSMRASTGGTWNGKRWVEMSEPTRRRLEAVLFPTLVQQLTPARRGQAQVSYLGDNVDRAKRYRDDARATLDKYEAEYNAARAELDDAIGNLDYSKRGE